MQVILKTDVPKVGQVGDVCKVAGGFGRNYLLPQGLAILATPGALKQIGDLKRSETRRQDRQRAEMNDLAAQIGRQALTFKARVGETGRLYGSITATDIAEALEAQLGSPVDRRKIVLDDTIRTLGDHNVPIHLMQGINAMIKVTVEADGELVPDKPTETTVEDDAWGKVTVTDLGDDDDDEDDEGRGRRGRRGR